ncbi:hypothetical protein PV325_010255 [Microctonus aethiopoides]|nr:hypothetical protein PV325_010255 [Microctonus aethiopoides]
MIRHGPYSIKIQNDVLEVYTNDWTNMEKPFEKFASKLHKIRIMDLVGYFLDFLPTDNLEDLSIILRREFEDEFKNCPQNSHMDKVLANSPKLKSLELNNVPVTELSSIGGMETLKALYIDAVELPRLSFDKKKLRNLETLGMVYEQVDSTANLIEIIRTCKKIHSVKFGSCDTSYDIILNEMISLPNLRRVCLENDPCESWYKFSNLESIHMMFSTPVSVTRYQLETLRLLLEFLPTENLENLSVHLLESEYRVYLPEWNHLMGNILSKTPKLKALELNYLPISELSSIGGMGTLETLFIQTTDLPRLNFDINELRNLKTLSLFCPGYNIPDITKLMKKCRKIHTLRIISMCRLPEDTMNEMISLPNLRRLHLFKTSNSCDWDKFSNLEEIRISHNECYPKSRDQIISFLQRSKNLKYFDLHSWRHRDFNRVIRKIIRDIGFEYNEHRREAWIDFPGMSK